MSSPEIKGVSQEIPCDFQEELQQVWLDPPVNCGGIYITASVVNCNLDINTPEYNLAREVYIETDKFREINDLPSLNEDIRLIKVAKDKAEQMLKDDLWSHKDLSGNFTWNTFKKESYNFSTAGENLARGNFTAGNEIVNMWINSESHRKNLLDPSFKDVGIYVKIWGARYLIVMELGSE